MQILGCRGSVSIGAGAGGGGVKAEICSVTERPARRSNWKDDSAAEAGGVVLHQNGSIGLVETNATNTVDIVELRNRAHSVFRRMLGVAKLNIDVCGHSSIINGYGGRGCYIRLLRRKSSRQKTRQCFALSVADKVR